MNSITDFSRQCSENRIKFLKQTYRGYFLWMIFILTMTFYDCQALYEHPNALSGFGVGCMLVTALWTIFFLIEQYTELKNEKLKFKFLTELDNTRLASDELREYSYAKNHYERLINNLKNQGHKNEN